MICASQNFPLHLNIERCKEEVVDRLCYGATHKFWANQHVRVHRTFIRVHHHHFQSHSSYVYNIFVWKINEGVCLHTIVYNDTYSQSINRATIVLALALRHYKTASRPFAFPLRNPPTKIFGRKSHAAEFSRLYIDIHSGTSRWFIVNRNRSLLTAILWDKVF